MALQVIAQEHRTGCFVACIAMLLGKTYNETLRILHPGESSYTLYEHGFLDMSVENAAFKALNIAGIKAHRSRFKKFRTYRKYDKHALLIIRWKTDPAMCHTILYDGEAHRFIDPDFGTEPSRYHLKSFEDQLDTAIIVDQLPEVKHDIFRADSPAGNTWGESPY